MTVEIARKDLDWWRSKIVRGAQNHRHGGLRGFGPIAARHAIHLLEQVVSASPSYRLAAPTVSDFSKLVGLRSKFVPRALWRCWPARDSFELNSCPRRRLRFCPIGSLAARIRPNQRHAVVSHRPNANNSSAATTSGVVTVRNHSHRRSSKLATSCLFVCSAPIIKRIGSRCAESTMPWLGTVSTRRSYASIAGAACLGQPVSDSGVGSSGPS